MAKILVVDDSALVQEVLQFLLEDQGHEVKAVGRVVAAINLLREETFDLILMDLKMPGPRGEDGIRALRQRLHIETPVIVLSGEITPAAVESLKGQQVAGFVDKTVDFEAALLAKIAEVLGGQGA